MKRGTTLPELLTTILIFGITLSMGIPKLAAQLDQYAVRNAVTETVTTFSIARQMAIAHAAYVVVRIDSAAGTVTVTLASDTIVRRAVGALHGVTIASNRDSLAYTPIGVGFGAANQSIRIRRGSSTDTVVISRLGRVRY